MIFCRGIGQTTRPDQTFTMFPVRLSVESAYLAPQRQIVTLRLAGERKSLAAQTLNRLTYLLRQEFGG